mmetsp:Transcript_38588/g.59811  ORF Transcript_38588/g.59811 Transcript_38588/m.59811 type:complete len:277 (-) Transcript_38588:488-1318(-)
MKTPPQLSTHTFRLPLGSPRSRPLQPPPNAKLPALQCSPLWQTPTSACSWRAAGRQRARPPTPGVSRQVPPPPPAPPPPPPRAAPPPPPPPPPPAAAAAAAEAAPPAAVAEVARAAAAGPAGKLLESAGGLFGGPLHASCKLKWEFATKDCTAVQAALRSAAVAMAGFEGCQEGGEKCGYSIEEESSSDNDTHLKLLHETPTKHYQDTILLEFSSGDGIMCEVEGHSSSDTWYAVLDNGTNYCNLHNLVEAAELEFKEWTSDSVCTQYSSADCLVY